MSAAPAYPQRTQVRSVQGVRVQRRRKDAWLPVLLGRVVIFVAAAGCSFGFSTLLGFSLKETARRDAIRSIERAKVARADVSRIRERVERLTTMVAVEEWSKFNGYVTNYQFAKGTEAKTRPRPAVKVAQAGQGLHVDVLVARVGSGADVQ